MSPWNVRALIFDVDGTLVDSNDQHARAFELALRSFDYPIPFSSIRPLIGMNANMVLKTLLPYVNSVSREQIVQKKNAIFSEEFLPTIKPFPATLDLLATLKGAGLKLATASSANPESLSDLLETTGLEPFFDVLVSSSDVVRSKPEPDIVCAAVKKLGFPPNDVLMVGDTPYDIQAAKRAGVGCVAFRCGGCTDDILGEAVAVCNGPEELLLTLQRHEIFLFVPQSAYI